MRVREIIEKILVYFGLIKKDFKDNMIVAEQIDKVIFNIKNKSDREKFKLFLIISRIIREIYYNCAINIGIQYLYREKFNDESYILMLKTIVEFFKSEDNAKICSLKEYEKFNTEMYFLLKNLYNKLK